MLEQYLCSPRVLHHAHNRANHDFDHNKDDDNRDEGTRQRGRTIRLTCMPVVGAHWHGGVGMCVHRAGSGLSSLVEWTRTGWMEGRPYKMAGIENVSHFDRGSEQRVDRHWQKKRYGRSFGI